MTQATTPSFIDLHASGLGYLSRVREVKPKKGNPFLAASINAFHGEVVENGKSELTYVKFDLKVTGEQAIADVRSLEEAANDEDRKVIVSFNIGDFYIDTFQYTKGDKAGQTGTVLKGRLLKVRWAKVDGEKVIDNAPAPVAVQPAETPADAPSEAPAEQAA